MPSPIARSAAVRIGDLLLERRIQDAVVNPTERHSLAGWCWGPWEKPTPTMNPGPEPLGLGRLIARQVVHPRVTHNGWEMVPFCPKHARKDKVKVRELSKLFPEGGLWMSPTTSMGVGPITVARRPKSSGRSLSTIVPLYSSEATTCGSVAKQDILATATFRAVPAST